MPGYFAIMGISLRGREFDDGDRETTRRVAIVARFVGLPDDAEEGASEAPPARGPAHFFGSTSA